MATLKHLQYSTVASVHVQDTEKKLLLLPALPTLIQGHFSLDDTWKLSKLK